MEHDRLKEIREAERKSHTDIYSSAVLFEEGTWLNKPIKTVTDLLPEIKCKDKFTALDLGCGIGRNCIPVAQYFKYADCQIDCVDILELAITQLEEYSEKYDVGNSVNGTVMPLEEYQIKPNYYDLILAISSLEHVENEDVFLEMLMKIKEGIRKDGIVCLVINSNVVEIDKETQEQLPPQFEVNIQTEVLKSYLERLFGDWETLKYTVIPQEYEIPRESTVCLSSDVVTLVARK